MSGNNTGALLIIAAFMIIPLIMGAVAGKKSIPTTEDFFVQGRGMGSVAVFFTVAATWWSAFAFMGSNAYFFKNGPLYWTAIAWNLLFGIMYFGVGKKIWYLGKLNNFITAKDFFVHQYGSTKLGNLVAIISLVFTLPYLQIQLTGGAYLIETASGGIINFKIAALLFYVIIIIYVWSGGLRAVAWTDIFYGILLFFGMVFAGFYIANLLGGTTEVFAELKEVKPENLILGNNAMGWLSMFIVTPIGSFMGPQLWTRMYAVKSGRLFNLMPFLLGFAAIAYIGSMLVGNSAVLLEPNIENPDYVLPVILFKYAPFVLASAIIACGAAAAMSTANSQIHSMSAVWTVDIHQKYINKDLSQKQLVWVGRWTILILSAIAYVMCLLIPGLLVQIGLVALAGTAQIFIPTAGALFWKKSNTTGAFAGIVAGVAALCSFTFVPATLPAIFAGGGGLISLLVNLVVFIMVSSLTKPRPTRLIEKLQEQYKAFYEGKDLA
ncbi:MAG: sodium:solute symporter family protein [Clostridiales Family XIII bacterium]|jgi:SSS family solute:Na+ symporter|nr:sodium:solute symporter family protein [Clostridiales Family XIII bacterium]